MNRDEREKILQTLEFPAIREILERYCLTPLGRAVARAHTPFHRVEAARRALRQVEEMAALLLGDRPPPLHGAEDGRAEIDRARGRNKPMEPDALYRVYRLLRCARELRRWLPEPEASPETAALLHALPDLEDLEEELGRTVDARGRVLDTASPRLAEIRARMDRLKTDVRRRAEALLRRREVARWLQEPNVTFRNMRLVLPVRVEARRRIPGILHDYSASGNTAFVEPEELVEPQNVLEEVRRSESREVSRLLWERTRRIMDAEEEVAEAQRITAWIDFTRARAQWALEWGLVVPRLSSDPVLHLRKARHPLLFDLAFRKEEGPQDALRAAARDAVVPCDLHLGDRFRVLVISGPNTGGKTVVLKTAGLLAVMGASGLPVPAGEGTEIPFYEAVLPDIGDEQDLFQNLSTFSSHMERIRAILRRASPRTLVLLDELGSGTDPLEGEALSRSILAELLERRAPVLVSTHLSRLKEFAFSVPGVENASVEFDPDSLRPTYRLRIGIPGASNALRVARRLGIPEAVVDRAEAALEKVEERGLQSLMDDIQRVRIQAEAALERTREEARALRRLKEEIEAREKEAAFRREILEEEKDREIDAALRKVRDEARALLRRLESVPAPHRETVEALRGLVEAMLERTSLGEKRRRYVEGLKKGDRVYLPRYRERCRVLRILKKEKAVEVMYRNLTLRVPFDEIMWPHWY